MATYKVLYWQEIPSQIRVEDGADEVNLSLGPEFEKLIDKKATERGLIGTDEYLDQWQWGDDLEREGTAQAVAEAVAEELKKKTFES
jgi:hypothetical protein